MWVKYTDKDQNNRINESILHSFEKYFEGSVQDIHYSL